MRVKLVRLLNGLYKFVAKKLLGYNFILVHIAREEDEYTMSTTVVEGKSHFMSRMITNMCNESKDMSDAIKIGVMKSKAFEKYVGEMGNFVDNLSDIIDGLEKATKTNHKVNSHIKD